MGSPSALTTGPRCAGEDWPWSFRRHVEPRSGHWRPTASGRNRQFAGVPGSRLPMCEPWSANGGCWSRPGIHATSQSGCLGRLLDRDAFVEAPPGISFVAKSPQVGTACSGPDDYAFSSLFNSFRNRQSVPCAISFWGPVLINPLSWSRTPKNRRESSGL